MKTCDNCFNKTSTGCGIMASPPDELFCWATKEMQLKRERDCLKYTESMDGTVRSVRKRIKALEGRNK